MKVELTEQEQKQLKRAVDNNPIRKFLLSREENSFEVGDILIKSLRRWKGSDQYEWQPESISSENKMPQRYVFIFKDEFGIGYMKQLKVSTGKLGKEIYCLSDYDTDSTKFEVDPEYAEKIFLDADFDIKDIHKKSLEARKIVSKLNRKAGVKPKTLSQFNSFFDGMKAGDKFYLSGDYTAKWSQEYEIIDIRVTTTIQLESTSDYSWRNFKNRWSNNLSVGVDAAHTFKVKYKEVTNYGRERDTYVYDMGGRDMVFYKQEPAKEDKK